MFGIKKLKARIAALELDNKLLGEANLRQAKSLSECIPLTEPEIQSGLNRVRQAANLIRQLPEDHDGRNTWLMNYGEEMRVVGGRKPSQPVER